jgi:hypothetical protein
VHACDQDFADWIRTAAGFLPAKQYSDFFSPRTSGLPTEIARGRHAFVRTRPRAGAARDATGCRRSISG